MNQEQKNEYGLLIAKKSEKLVTALYLVTDLMTDKEPIKGNLRKISVTLLSSMNALAQPEVKDRVTEYKVSLRGVTEILSLLHVARTTGIVSDMNSSLLIDGFRSLQLVLEKKQPVLTKDMLAVENEEKLQEGEVLSSSIRSSSYDALTPLALARFSPVVEDSYRNKTEKISAQGREIEDTKVGDIKELKTQTTKENKGQENFKGQNIAKHVPMLTSYQQKKVSRRDQIHALFVKGVDVSIKDIASRIKGCSEKTIQRELNALVYDNKIVRIGEKRWSRYMLR